VVDFVTGNCTNALQEGEVLRSIFLPATALESRTAFRKIALSPLGRSGAVIIGRRAGAGLEITLTASTVRPVLLAFDELPDTVEQAAAISALPMTLWHDDPHGPPDWRAQVSAVLAEQIRVELSAPTSAEEGATRQEAS
jgi:xanthine dehydrogenase iron-sulfur cluster and FAD-binding subunit A